MKYLDTLYIILVFFANLPLQGKPECYAGRMILSLIVAAAENNVIGANGTIPWHLPDDLKHFKALTHAHPVIMGRKTYDSIGRALPDRPNIVVSRNLEVAPVGTELAHSLSDAIKKGEAHHSEEIFIIGGSELYGESMDLADRIYLTRVHATIEGDTLFPEIDDEWKEVARERHEADATHKFSFSFITFEKA